MADDKSVPVGDNYSNKDAIVRVNETVSAADGDQEQSIWAGGYSPKAMIGTWILCGLISVAVLVVSLLTEWPPIMVALIAIVVLWVVAASVYGYRRLGVAYELTTQRFIHQAGLLSRRTDRIEVIDIDDVSVRQGPVQRVLGVGTIEITSSDRTHPLLKMNGIDEVKKIAGTIDDIRRKERRRRSLHIEAI